jgi:hypothetical protein
MSLIKNWGLDLQLFADEGQKQEPVESEPVTTGAEDNKNETTEAKQEEIQKDPIELLREEAEKLGVKDFMLLTPAELDRKITQAIKTREEKLRKQQEVEEMKKKGEFEKLLRQERREFLEDILTEKLESAKIPFVKDFINIDTFLDLDRQEAKQKILGLVDGLTKTMQEEIEKRLSERVKELEKGSYVANPQNIIESDNPKDMLRQLFKNG